MIKTLCFDIVKPAREIYYMLYEILLIILCMFAALGFSELIIAIFNYKCAKRLPHKFKITVTDIDKEQAEFVIRYLEELLFVSGADAAIDEIVLGEGADIDDSMFEVLQKQFGNIRRQQGENQNSILS